ncbi:MULTISPECIES: hypothetical protein [unclassified Paenibacillus]|uniref:hypothetical protein n=2 Tax=Paenibacillus TaxID=44249 RepID=UPI0009A60AB4|nr:MULTISPECIES: hypothetical protein [unclassified Paenibacillus]SLK18510.1 hypothetical protein SAMN06272722_112169 [Paenibacillus sp. RU5A]SOC75292.1 hypothetical protein SAMN05880581_112169 [Paenibacillus sp. RU26A]SOC77328.1 hypothetical protein SAMN05880586_112169 [Paenibacillus sp. RU5M]
MKLNEFHQAVQHHKQMIGEHEWELFNYSYSMDRDGMGNLHERAWQLPSRVYGEILKFVYPLTRVPVLLVHTGRIYGQQHFHDFIGEFIDFVPCVLDTHSEHPFIDNMEEPIRFLREHNINMASMLTESDIQQRYPMVSSVLNDINAGRLNIPIYNYLAMYQHTADLGSEAPSYPDVEENLEVQVAMTSNVYMHPLNCK